MTLSSGQGGDPTLIRTGAHKITVDPSGDATVVGFTHGDLALTIAPQTRERNVAEFGTTPLDILVTGVKASVKFTMMERSLKTLGIAFNGLYPLTTASTSIAIGRSGVQSAQDRGKTLLLHPIRKGAATDQDITLYKVMLMPTGNISLNEQGDEMHEVEGTCVVDISQTDGGLLLSIGETNAGA